MAFVLLGLELYLASVLGASALAKIERPNEFAATLQRYQLFPRWSVALVSTVVPYFLITTSGMLVIAVLPIVSSVMALGFFSSFLVIESILVITKRATECGCYGLAYRQKVDGASIVASGILVTIAAFHFWAVTWVDPVSGVWRWGAWVIFAGMALWLSCGW